ncbi:MAG: hypothetical protein JNM90_20700 [Burkholderiales bacterium]|nr:hypothetical protein [Burkholderiales bacterium]
MKSVIAAVALGLLGGSAWAKLPPPPPKAPEVVEAEKAKEAEARKKGAELQAKYEDRAVASYAAKAKAEGKEFKPQLGAGVQPPPPPAAPVAAAAPTAPAPAKAAGAPAAKK